VTLQIPETQGVATLQIPLSALADAGQGTGVWIIEDADLKAQEATPVWRPVVVAGLGAETASLSGGLAPGERFVAMGAHMLHPGTRVRIGENDPVARHRDASQ
jgi:multidrug efflux pump subunit AcrA (membrane-fusion protein)